MKYLAAAGIVLVFCAASFALGFYLGNDNAEPMITRKGDISAPPVSRDYSKMSKPEAIDELLKYDQGPPTLDIFPITNTPPYTHRLKAGLNEREWSRDVTINCGSSGNWKYYAGFGALGGIIGGVVIYKIIK